MIDLIWPDARLGFAAPLMEMHQHRKRVFVDQLGWSLPVRGSWLEVDEFDDDFAVYLLARSPEDGTHQGSVRLLPTTRPHLLSALFSDLCGGEVPVGETIWEISRLVTSPGANAGSAVRLHRLLALALLEFAALNGTDAYTLVIEANRLPALLSVGWKAMPLGLPKLIGSQEVMALRIDIDESSLPSMRARLKMHEPVLRSAPCSRKAA